MTDIYNDQAKFYADYTESTYKHVNEDYKEVSCEAAWFLYNYTYGLRLMGVEVDGQPTHFFGRLVEESDSDDYKNPQRSHLVPKIGEHEKKNFHSLDGYLETGTWNVTVNDAWLLAGVHSLCQYRACTPIVWDNILCDKHIVKVIGRELIGLALAGYSEKATSDGHKVYVPGSEKKAEDLTFAKYDSEVSKLKDHAQVKAWFASNSSFNIPQSA